MSDATQGTTRAEVDEMKAGILAMAVTQVWWCPVCETTVSPDAADGRGHSVDEGREIHAVVRATRRTEANGDTCIYYG